ncbi:MAG: FAD-dependent oxidoreductase, partial [Halioglobus sp.]|nr:FAD-dependent oxidoreductase [Halioglobus sp.]
MDEFDVCVIGAGFGGATVAALLAGRGLRVALIEKTARAGGKTQTTERKGYRFEMFGAVGIPAYNSRFHELVDTLGIAERCPFVVPEGDAASIRYKNSAGEWKVCYNPLIATGSAKEMNDMKATFGVTDDDLGALASMYEAILTLQEDEIDGLDDVGALSWLRRFKLATPLESQVCMNLNTLFVVAVDRLPASEMIRTLRDQVLGGAGRYHIGGYGHVAEVCADYVVEQGGLYLTKTRVQEVLVENGRAVGVRLNDREIRAAAVISSAGIQPTVLKLAGRQHFPADYVERVSALEPSWAICGFRYVLDKRVFDAALIPVFSDQSWLDEERYQKMLQGEWPDVPLIAIDVPSEFDPGLSDIPGHQLANCQVFMPADPDSELVDEAIRRCDAVINELWPELEDHIIRKEPYGAKQISSMSRDAVVPGCGGEAVGIAQVVGQCGGSKP